MASKLVLEGKDKNGKGTLYAPNSKGQFVEITLADGATVSPGDELEDGRPGFMGGAPGEHYVDGPALITTATTGDVYLRAQANGQESLFVYDPKSNSSWEVQGTVGTDPDDLIEYNSVVYFNAVNIHGLAVQPTDYQLFQTVETTTGANAVTSSGYVPYNPSSMVVYKDALYMNAQDSNGNYDLYDYNTVQFTTAGPVFKEIGPTNFNPTDMTVAGSDLFMNGYNGSANNLYLYNPSMSQPELIDSESSNSTDAEGNHGRDPIDIVASPVPPAGDSVIFFSGVKDIAGDRNIYETKVSAGGVATTQAAEGGGVGGHPSNLDPYDLTAAGNYIYFTGNDVNSSNGRGLYMLNAATNDYEEVLKSSEWNLDNGTNGDNGYNTTWGNLNPNTLTVSGGTLYFDASHNGGPAELYSLQLNANGSPATANPVAVAVQVPGSPGHTSAVFQASSLTSL
jgi:hypothetical protein